MTDRRYPGFPIAEVAEDGSSVITKHPGTGGLVSVGTVTAQLLYEIAEPAYLGPDVVTHFDTIRLTQQAEDRVAISNTKGSPPPDTLKVALNEVGDFRNTMTMALTGLDIEAKAAFAEQQLLDVLGGGKPSTKSTFDCCILTCPTRRRTSRPARICVRRSRTPTRGRWAGHSPAGSWRLPWLVSPASHHHATILGDCLRHLPAGRCAALGPHARARRRPRHAARDCRPVPSRRLGSPRPRS
ncbi:acyclic terpene utilization AtuA family protein [Mycobacterium avium]|uniref:acyclic terpene utilization AtuA family protein n=1 Tax=Mycobacterium avium TaxID=1764 RepID=UPI003AB92DF6